MALIEPKSRLSTRTILVAIVLILSVSIGAIYFGLGHLNQSPCPSGATIRAFLIVSSINGFNDSKDRPLSLNVQKNDCVLVAVENTDNQAHGLAVQTYAPSGIVVGSGETKSMQFHASLTGQFRISESIFSTIYIYDDGLLNVTLV